MKFIFLLFIYISVLSCSNQKHESKDLSSPDPLPNIILILADDMGYGDPQCYNDDSQIPTPHLNRLAAEGMMFTNAHTNSSVCTPTRYGIITGEYSWRGPLKRGVTWSYDAPIIERNQTTIASMLKAHGYSTAAIGKWHLGMGWSKKDGNVMFQETISPGPNDLGFDYFYGIAASLDIPPYVYIENNHVTEVPGGFSEGGSKNAVDDFWRHGPISSDFNHYEVLDHLTSQAVNTIGELQKQHEPFFLYFALTAPHTPWIPKDKFKSISGAGNYGDLAAQVDDVVGQIQKAVIDQGIEEETLIIFTSDNGSPLTTAQMAKFNHAANGLFKGRKGDIHEGGNRVPFIVKWPGKTKIGSTSDQLVSTTDFMATFADLIFRNAEKKQGIRVNKKDSKSFLDILLSKTPDSARNSMVYHSATGMFGFRKENWLFIEGKGDGGFIEPEDTTCILEPYQLYDLASDPSQNRNLYSTMESRASELLLELQSLKE